MKNCGTCKFWTEGKNSSPWQDTCPQGFGGCNNTAKIKRRTHMSHTSWNGMSIDMMVTENDEEWGFWTGVDFGCIHHES